MSGWDPILHGREARVHAAWSLEVWFGNDSATAFQVIAEAFGFKNWDDLRLGTTPDMIPQLEALAGPNGYAILKAMLAKRS